MYKKIIAKGIPNLTIIGERLNYGFRVTKELLDNEDIGGLASLAVSQVEKGAGFLTINIGNPLERPDFLREHIRSLQDAVDVPLAFDSTEYSVHKICLETYDPKKAKGRKPIVNSINESRLELLNLLDIQPFHIVIMASQRLEDGVDKDNLLSKDIVDTSLRLVPKIMDHGLSKEEIYVDVAMAPIASDAQDQIRNAVEAIRQIGKAPELQGIHIMVGLSNLSIGLPSKAQTKEGYSLKVPIESAFITKTIPLGLDTILGSPGRGYSILPEDNFVMQAFNEAISQSGFDALARIAELVKFAKR